jgi:hypothetical protein
MRARVKTYAFSLVETVLALGIFAFCIVVVIGVLLSGMRAARSVTDETNAVSIANSILGAWGVQVNKAAPLRIGDHAVGAMVTNLPPLNAAVPRGEFYFNEVGRQTNSVNGASLKLFYSVTPDTAGGTSLLELEFWWPPLAPTNAAQRRSFARVFSL